MNYLSKNRDFTNNLAWQAERKLLELTPDCDTSTCWRVEHGVGYRMGGLQ
jgi:hypothetical protein